MILFSLALALVFVALRVSAQGSTTTSAVATASPSTTLAPTAVIPPGVTESNQTWCTDPIFCAGPILQSVELSEIFPDSKTFPDKPTKGNISVTVAAFQAYQASGGNLTISELEDFVDLYFTGEGQELSNVQIASTFNASAPAFLPKVADPILRAFVVQVIGYWSGLIRETNETSVCAGGRCDSTLIPLNHTIVVPGGRYREVYYWDSFWIIEGLLNSGLADYAKNVLLNFMDELDKYGFIPNGGRTYYLNRSQPPLFIQMLYTYTQYTNDTSLLARALPLADIELNWWRTNRTTAVKSPYTNRTWEVARYDVFLNTAPRPEGYLEDYQTVNLAQPALNSSQATELYQELASGAESGWDYSSRFIREPLKNVSDPLEALRSINIRNIIPIDLNAILAAAHYRLADLYDLTASNRTLRATFANATARASLHRSQGNTMKSAILDLMWDPIKLSFYDFNTTSSSRNNFYSLATFYPFWLELYPPQLLTNQTALYGAFSGLNAILERYNGSVPCTLVPSTLNWDFPNAWPPHQYIIWKALANLPSNITTVPYTTAFPSNVPAFSLVPPMQLGFANESLLPPQPGYTSRNATGETSGMLVNGGNNTSGESWRNVLLSDVVNRYFTSVFCSWYSTGGSLPGLLTQLPADQLNVTNSMPSGTGQMFEKFNSTDTDAAGGGGEYTVVTGFGWTNGALIAGAAQFGPILNRPQCPAIVVQNSTGSTGIMEGRRVLGGVWKRGG